MNSATEQYSEQCLHLLFTPDFTLKSEDNDPTPPVCELCDCLQRLKAASRTLDERVGGEQTAPLLPSHSQRLIRIRVRLHPRELRPQNPNPKQRRARSADPNAAAAVAGGTADLRRRLGYEGDDVRAGVGGGVRGVPARRRWQHGALRLPRVAWFLACMGGRRAVGGLVWFWYPILMGVSAVSCIGWVAGSLLVELACVELPE
jgi:hypothetical protein